MRTEMITFMQIRKNGTDVYTRMDNWITTKVAVVFLNIILAVLHGLHICQKKSLTTVSTVKIYPEQTTAYFL